MPALLRPEPLEPAVFAPFGTVIRFDPAGARTVNEGTARRADTAAVVEHGSDVAPVLALYRTEPQALPLALSLFERHPHSTQTFVSLSVPRFLIVVAPRDADGLPDRAAARAFLGESCTGVSYRRDQWHTPLLALGEGGDLLMLMAEGQPTDCIEHRLATPLLIGTPLASEGTTDGP